MDFSANSVAAAIRERADLLIVHHGMFWRGTHALVGPAYERLRAAVVGNLAVYSSHIPLDLHPLLGNNVQLARELRLEPGATFGRFRSVEIGLCGDTNVATRDIVDRVRTFSRQFNTTASSFRIAGFYRRGSQEKNRAAATSPATPHAPMIKRSVPWNPFPTGRKNAESMAWAKWYTGNTLASATYHVV